MQSTTTIRSMWVVALVLSSFVRLSAAGNDGQPRVPPPSVTSGSIMTVDKLQHELAASSDILANASIALPTLSNGHLGFTVFGDAVYMATLYNGAGGLSHRARIPNVSNLRLRTGCYAGTSSACTLALNMAQGLFRIEGVFGASNVSYRVVHRVFPHALYRRLIVNQFLIERLSTDTGPVVELHLNPPVPFTSGDIRFSGPARTAFRVHSSPSSTGRVRSELIYQRCGRTVEVENRTYQPETSPVCVLWNHVPERLTLAADDRQVSFQFVMAVDASVAIARRELRTALLLQSDEELLRAHTSLWGSFWDRTDILTTGSGPLQRTVRASIFYLVSNFPFEESFGVTGPGPFGGLSPTGLGRGGGATGLDDYEGHSFWDTEIWMLPVLNLVDPWYGRLLVDYRARLLEVAIDLAAAEGYAGARYPWESGYTGVEVTQPCCPEVAQYQHHITGDVSYGLRQHFATTQDLEWLQESGCRVAQETADFWTSRLAFNYTGSGQYDIAAVMGPDEDHENVTNNAYTNVIAGYALYFGDFVSCLCDNGTGSWRNRSLIARQLKLPYDATRDYHPQFEGYQPGTVIKQADTVLLGFPLQYPGMKPSTRSNDLRTYESVTRSTGPAMTWAMHAINHLDLGELAQAARNFNRSYQPYVCGPFHVWHELQQPDTGAQNFLTGAGGFLQAVLFGYAGIRIHLDRLEVHPTVAESRLELPPGSTGITAKGLRYLGALITIVKAIDQSEVIVTHLATALTIEFTGGNAAIDVTVNETYNLNNRTAIIRPKHLPYRGCNLPEDIIGAFIGTADTLSGSLGVISYPNYGNIQLANCAPTNGGVPPTQSCTYQLDMKEGKFVTVDENGGTEYRVIHEVYPHRYYDMVLVNRVRVQRLGSQGTIQARLLQIPGMQSQDFNMSPRGEFLISGVVYQQVCGVTVQVENPDVQRFGHDVCVSYPSIPESVQIPPESMAEEFVFFTTFTATEEEGRRIIGVIAGLTPTQENASHMNEMLRLWERYDIAVEGNSDLNRVIKASAYYLFSSLPAHTVVPSSVRRPFYGLAPAGLGRGGLVEQEYQGHSFWDTEIWMYPAILMVDPINAAKVLSYRTTVGAGARMNAQKNGYDGVQFPWESAFTGTEVTPDCCPEVANYQHHITADIAFAVRQYYLSTGDMAGPGTEDCRIVVDAARFWLSRAQYNNVTDLFDIRNAMGPDEDHPNVSNNAFTNIMAANSLFFGEFASCHCRDNTITSDIALEMMKVARGLTLLYDAERDFHPQFEGYQLGTMIKQADTVLLIYPLQHPMNVTTKANNLRMYSQVTRENGPAMTWAIHTIGHLELNQVQEAATMFEKSYSQYLRAPYNVWSENGNNEPGAGNFITGAGGFLQAIINGYAGVRLELDRLVISNARPTPNTNTLIIPTIEYRGVRFSLTVRSNGFVISFKTATDLQHKLLVDNKEQPICLNCNYTAQSEISLQITPVPISGYGCKLRPTTLGIKVADQNDAAPGLHSTSMAFVSLIVCFLLSKLF